MENKSLAEKLSNIQIELKAPKNQFNKFGGYNYRSCEDILEAVKPICHKYRTTLLLTDDVRTINEMNYVRCVARLLDWDSSITYDVVSFAREPEQRKGMDASQITGASSSYARKYALNGLFNIDDTKDADFTNTTNANKSNQQQQDEEERLKLAKEINDYFQAHKDGSFKGVLLAYMKQERKKNISELSKETLFKLKGFVDESKRQDETVK